ncbi:hypothetical protein FBUS_11772 [Fasciolopsis buskii]|uniref:Aminopeptidase N-like N-terminal domain-containing protein n=1 Tax=Fasciolopsis buskii TaxID=27845 RepID=A0A8E0RNL8_9TREM|nr:hypothetical protein FBUS_11772 [Fasciolopsis buski]
MLDGASAVVLNAKDMTVNSAKFNGEPVEIVQKPESEQIHLPLGRKYHTGPATLDLEFTGEISDKMSGFYRSSYADENESKKVILATHFEPSWGRKAFPCWDEPDFKSIFSIKLLIPKHMTAISNMVSYWLEQSDVLVFRYFQFSRVLFVTAFISIELLTYQEASLIV